jgi:alpha-galactosidase
MRLAFQIIRETVGEATYLLGCGAPLAPAVGLVDAMRIAPDTAPSWTPRWPLRDNPSMPGLRNSLHVVTARAWMHNRWWTNDPDPLIMRDTQTRLTDDEVRAQVTLLGLSGGTFMLSDPLDALPPERREMAATLLPPLLEGMDVLDLFDDTEPSVVVVPVARAWARWRLVGLFNWRDEPVERSLPADLSLDERRAYHIVDFWARRYLHFADGDLVPVFHLPPHGAVLLGLRPVKPDPHLVATTFHISQGGEVTNWALEADGLSLRLDLGRRAQGEIWFALPGRPTHVHLNDTPISQDGVRAISRGIWAVRCFVNRTATLRLGWGAS